MLFILFCIFFFQAEDGIRDLTVTGVQTCALPISEERGNEKSDQDEPRQAAPRTCSSIWMSPRFTPLRSEEHTSELQSQSNLVCRLLLEKKKTPELVTGVGHIFFAAWLVILGDVLT